jgi:hypothetical protein
VKAILKPIFEMLTGEFVLFGNVLYNYVAMAAIGLVAFLIAFGVVGKLYGEGAISSRGFASLVHWIIRLVVFIVVFYILSWGIWLARTIMAIS